jgi:methionyl-tRNA synthetase
MDWCRRNGAEFDSYWRRSDESDVYHFIGKDIVYFHALFWPAMLMGSGFRTPTQLFVHGFLTVNHEKMSKSRGTFVTAETYLSFLDPQYLRYYYAAKLTSRVEDLDLSLDDFVQRVDADLVNKIANIPSRVLAIVHRDCGGQLGNLDDRGRELIVRLRGRCSEVGTLYEKREYGQVTRSVVDMAAEINAYLQEHKPWQVVKEDITRAQTICTVSLNAFKIVATMLTPILPEFAEKVAKMLKVPPLTWANLDDVIAKQAVEPYERLVNRIDRKRVDAMMRASQDSTEGEEVELQMMTLDGLVDCDFRTMQVAGATPIVESQKLVEVKLDFADGERTVVATLGRKTVECGIVGRNVLVLANLQPKKICGRESHGMIIAADVDGKPVPVCVSSGQRNAIVE